MRILIASHEPIDEDRLRRSALALALALEAAGHVVRALVVDRAAIANDVVPTRRIVCRRDDPAADLPFDRPGFGDQAHGLRFSDLSDGQLAAYRDALRRALDEEIVAFDPQIIHCERIWLFGHLALESGVPYVLVAHLEELLEALRDSRYGRLAQEAAENAGRIIVPDAGLAERIRSMLGESAEHFDGRIEIVPWADDLKPPGEISDFTTAIASIYQQVLNERHGRRPES